MLFQVLKIRFEPDGVRWQLEGIGMFVADEVVETKMIFYPPDLDLTLPLAFCTVVPICHSRSLAV